MALTIIFGKACVRRIIPDSFYDEGSHQWEPFSFALSLFTDTGLNLLKFNILAVLTAKLRRLVFCAAIVHPLDNAVSASTLSAVGAYNVIHNLPEGIFIHRLKDKFINPKENQTAN